MKVTRRRFIESTALTGLAAVPAATGASLDAGGPPAVQTTAGRDSSFDPWLEIHGDHLRHNVAEIGRRTHDRPIIAVVKNNGYGAGVAEIGRLLDPIDAVHVLAVVKLQEAMTLRDAGVRKPVLLMGPFDERGLEDAVARDIMPMVYTPIGNLLDRVASRRQQPVPVHVCVDTGLGRVGVPHREAPALIRDLAARPSVRIRGVMMTFSEDPELDREQVRRFTSLCNDLTRDGVDIGWRHAASSFTLFQHPDAFFDAVRVGLATYGIYSEQAFRTMGALALRPAVAFRARVAYVKQVRAGESAGYSRAYVAERDTWVATLPVGHADGWPRVAARGASVRINGARFPVIASVSASHTILEIGPEKRVEIGDEATLFDWQDGWRPDDVSGACGASPYDLVMHLSALLPKRMV